MLKYIAVLLFYSISNSIFSQTMKKDQFKHITYAEAEVLKEQKDAQFVRNIPYNNGSVFVLSDSSYLIIPLNPLSISLLVYKEQHLIEMLVENRFPTNEKVNEFFETNKEKIENLSFFSENLINELKEYLRSNDIDGDREKINMDTVYRFLEEKGTLSKYKLHFILLLADFIIVTHDPTLRIALLRDKQTLNPIMSIVLVKQGGQNYIFFNLEENVFGRSGYFGIKGLLRSLDEFKRKVDGVFYAIDKVFDWPISVTKK